MPVMGFVKFQTETQEALPKGAHLQFLSIDGWKDGCD
jgi:hypothetical protein